MRLLRLSFGWAVATAALVFTAGCRQDMHNQPKFYPQRGTDFYVDGRSVRPQVENTVARTQLHEDAYFYTGMQGGKEGDSLPFPVTLQVLERGQERYNIYCTPCHSRVGNGAGMIVQRGYSPAGNLLGGRLRSAGLGHFFNVMSNGYGSMPDYSAQVTPVDRWAIAAYIRALQLSQSAQRSDVPAGAEVKTLVSIAESAGLPVSFAASWDVSSPAEMPGGAASVPKAADSPSATPDAATKPAPGQASGGSAAADPPARPITAAQAKAGLAIYSKNCQVCHQPTLGGMPPTFPSLVGVVGRQGSAYVGTMVTHGKAPMPAFTALTPADLDDLVAFLTDPSKAGVVTAPPPSK